MQITVKTLSGAAFEVSLDVTASTTVADLKSKVEDESGTPAAEQKLLLAGAELAPDAAGLAGLLEGASPTVHLLRREPGLAASGAGGAAARKKSATSQGGWNQKDPLAATNH